MLARQSAPHLLYVAWGFPPSRSGGVFRALATANAFARAGWRVTVLTAEREAIDRYIGSDPSLEEHVDSRIRVLRLPFRWQMHDTDIREYSWLRAHAPQQWRRIQLRRDMSEFPEAGYGSWRKTLEQAALDVHRRDPVDLVVATANPNVDFVAPAILHRRHRVPFVMDYRDAWLLDVFSGDMLYADGSAAARWERRLVASAREIWFVNEPIRAWHRERYPSSADRMHVVANGFDPELAPGARRRPEPGEEASGVTASLTYGYLGTISPKVPLEELLAGWRRARELDETVAASRLRLHGHLGYYAVPRADLLAQVEAGAADGVHYCGPVAKADVARVYESFDVLVLALGSGRYVTSGKVYEYLAAALPIVSVHDPANAVTEVLRGYPMWFPVEDLEPDTLARAIVQAGQTAAAASPQVRAQCLAFAAEYSRDRQLMPRIASLSAGAGWQVPPAGTAEAPGEQPGIADLTGANGRAQ